MLSRRAAVIGAVAALMLLGGGPAWADDGDDIWGGVDCTRVPSAGCELGAGRAPGTPALPHPGDAAPPMPHGGRGADAPAVQCSYVRSDYRPPSGGTVTVSYEHALPESRSVQVIPAVFRADVLGGTRSAQQPGQPPGAWYVYQCSGTTFRDALYRPPVWIPDGPGGGVSPAQLAEQAYRQLRLPPPMIRFNPAGAQLVNLPSWLWVDQQSWGPRSATVAIPGVSVTATATPSRVGWSMGDGSRVTCPSAGTPFPAGGDPAGSSPDCGHVYRVSSLGQPGHSFPVAATVSWSVRWSGAGQGGVFDGLSTTATAAITVVESQGVSTR